MIKTLSNGHDSLNITMTKAQYEMFETYYKCLIEWNKKVNLTAITEKDDVYSKHFYDSLWMSKIIKLHNQTLLDVGSGAGFPSIPLKIMYPSLKITIVDALKKRITFLERLCKELNIDINLIHGRIEDLKTKACYDIVTARAVAPLRILTELCLPFVKLGGSFIPYKSQKLEEELEESQKTIECLGGQITLIYRYEYDNVYRALVHITKIEHTPEKYPRKYKMILTKPL